MIVAGFGLVIACVVAIARKQQQDEKSGAEQPTIWDKMRKGMEEMPEDFPPRVMFDNVDSARVNTERILEILEADKGGQAADVKANA